LGVRGTERSYWDTPHALTILQTFSARQCTRCACEAFLPLWRSCTTHKQPKHSTSASLEASPPGTSDDIALADQEARDYARAIAASMREQEQEWDPDLELAIAERMLDMTSAVRQHCRSLRQRGSCRRHQFAASRWGPFRQIGHTLEFSQWYDRGHAIWGCGEGAACGSVEY
jgi:hypothetical protein